MYEQSPSILLSLGEAKMLHADVFESFCHGDKKRCVARSFRFFLVPLLSEIQKMQPVTIVYVIIIWVITTQQPMFW
jgi:hypothetical protein